MAEQLPRGVIIEIVKVNWDDIKSNLGADWNGFVADCRKAFTEYSSTQNLAKLETAIKKSLGKREAGKVILRIFNNTLDVAGVRLTKNPPEGTHPTDAVQNSVDELADKVEKEKSPQSSGTNSPTKSGK